MSSTPQAWRYHASTGVPRQLDTERLKRSFLGWLRSERDHCKMAAIPTLAQEDAKRPHRERETLVVEQTSIANRMKGIMARLGIRTFNPKLKKAPEHLQHVRTPEGEPIPTNTLAELYREMERLRLIREQILRNREGSPGASPARSQHCTESDDPPSGARDRDWH